MSDHRGRSIVLGWLLAALVIVGGHQWIASMDEDAAWMWSCRTMGDRECGPQQRWIEIQIGGSD